MSISKLHYFSKNTDATASIRGYKYQELKTLESWIQNKISSSDEILYCDYEDDIFHRDLNLYKSTFRQIKLYSSNFSFSSDEIKDALFHFFMLFSKGDYISDEISFVFETNSNIARRYEGNNAEILKKWSINQEAITDELIQEILPIVTGIIDVKIQSLVSNSDIDTSSHDYYKSVPIETWIDFVKKIKWKFNDNSPAVEMEILNNSIVDLLRNIESPIENEDVEIIYATLLKQVSEASTEENPLNRGLTVSKFDETIIKLGDRQDKWYLNNYMDWKDSDISEIKEFHPGWFFELLHSAEYCRKYSYADEHSEMWIKHLKHQLNSKNIPEILARRGFYELVFSAVKPHQISPTNNDITEYLGGIDFYFGTLQNHLNTYDLEKAKNLLTIVFTTWRRELLQVDEQKIHEWTAIYEKVLNQEIEKEKSPTERKCVLLQCLGFHNIFKSLATGSKIEFKESIDVFNQVIEIQESVASFNLLELSNLLNKTIGVLCQVGLENELEDLEEFSERISGMVTDRLGKMAYAKSTAKKGVEYLKSTSIKNVIKSINNFHKTKDIYQQADSMEGFVLALLNISQFYSLLNLNFASKYYSLCSSYVCLQKNDPSLTRKFSDSLSFTLLSDYEQGSWFSFLSTFQNYLVSLRSFNFQEFEYIEQKNTSLSLTYFVSICTLLPKISAEFGGLVKYHIQSSEKIFGVSFSELKSKIQLLIDTEGIDSFIRNRIDGNPINDSGPIRKIVFSAFATKWTISFENSYLMNSIGEEFISILQIYLGEILLSKYDFHLIETKLELTLNLTTDFKESVRKPNNQQIEWDIYLAEFASHDAKEVNMHYATIGAILFQVLSEITLLPKAEFDELTERLFKEQSLASKTLTVNTYQYIYRSNFSEEVFNSQQRSSFGEYEIATRNISKIPMDDRVSYKYDQEKSLDKITQRYINCQKCISKSLPVYLESEEFREYVIEKRNEGYLDWVILNSITNKIISLKVSQFIRQDKNETESSYIERMKEKHLELMTQDSEEDGIFVPVKYILEEDSNLQFEINVVGLLRSFDLESRATTPVFSGIRDLLNKKFNFKNDDKPEMSPFKF